MFPDDGWSVVLVAMGPGPRSKPRRSNSADREVVGASTAGGAQVWSLTQYYCVSQSRIGVKSSFSANVQSRVTSAVLWTSATSAAHLTLSLILRNSGSNARGKLRALERTCQLKKPFEGPRQRRGYCWEERKRFVFPQLGVINLPSGPINDFL